MRAEIPAEIEALAGTAQEIPLPDGSVDAVFAADASHWFDFDPAGTVHLWSADLSAAYLLSNRVQFDGGANFGLSRVTPDVEAYAGASVLF